VRAALDQVGLLGREQHRPIALSTGEPQRVGIARAIIAKPALLIADEPTGNLDPDLAVEIMNIFKRFNEVGVTVLIASHDVHLIERYGVRRIILEGGCVAGGTEPVEPNAGISAVTDTLTMPDLPSLLADRT
jgi:cell division transport system ATP-binding protein